MSVQYNRSENARRDFKVTGRGGFSGLGKRFVMIECPFCGTTSKAFIWSLAGGGKKCVNRKCGAKFSSYGGAYPVVGREDMTP